MSLQEDTQRAVSTLGLSGIPEEWVDKVWEDNFCESIELPSDQMLLLNSDAWRSLARACAQWRTRGTGDTDSDTDQVAGFWTTLVEEGVTYRSLLGVLFGLLERNKTEPSDRVCAVCAALVYLSLLQLPGSGAFKIFHPMLFQKTLDTFYLYPDTTVTAVKSAKVSGRGRKRKRACDENGERPEVIAGGEEQVRELLTQLITDLHCYLEDHPLSEHEACRYHLIQVLVRMTRADAPTRSTLTKHTLTSAPDEVPVSVWAWHCLTTLCQSKHGSVEKVVSEVFRQVLPSVLMMTREGGVTTSSPLPSHLTAASGDALTFICHLSAVYGAGVCGPLKNLVQHICTKTPDRAEYRSKLASAVCRLLGLFPDRDYSQLLDWVYKLSRNTKTSYRVFMLDLVGEIVEKPLRKPSDGLEGEEEYRLTHGFLVRTILSRCSDKAPSVCGRGLSCLASAAGSSSQEVVEAVRRTVQSRTVMDPLLATPNSSNESVVVAMVRRRTTHDKVGVRKSAVQALEALIRMEPGTNKEDLEALHARCLDPALSVRKQALASLTTLLLERQDTTLIHSYWLDGVLPMVLDREVGAQEKCLQLLEELLLANITNINKSTSPAHLFVWHLLGLIASGDHLDWRRYLCRALEHWSRAGKLTEKLVADVCSHTRHSDRGHVEASWMLLAGVSEFSSAVDAGFILDNWKRRNSFIATDTGSSLVQLLVVIGNQARHLGKIAMGDVKEDLVMLLGGFKLTPPVIQATMHTLCKICTALTTKKQNQSTLNAWCLPLLHRCEDYLSTLVRQHRDTPTGASTNLSDKSEQEAIRYLFTLGEVAHACPEHTSHHVGRLVQSILLASSDLTGGERSEVDSDGLSGLAGLKFSPTLRGHTYLTLGKLCLHNEELTKQSVVQMAQELETTPHQTIRNNLIIILCDLTVRYSAKVDPYIDTISACLKDPSLMVRRQTLTLLACLLQEDYVKWRGSLFFRFVSSLVDPELKRFGEFCLVHLLLARHPTMFYQHFIECVFHFNGYEKHKMYNRFKQSQREKELFSLSGTGHAHKRLTIYTFLLSHMADEHRLHLIGRLCQEVLGGLVDGAIPLDNDSVGVVKDTLAILACKEIKLSSLRRNVGEELAEEGDKVGAAVATAQTKFISQIVKRNVIENLVPVVIATKHLLERNHSPLLKDMLAYLKELMTIVTRSARCWPVTNSWLRRLSSTSSAMRRNKERQ
ncbi:condensin-2 complex subunit D3-L-like isoform X2 [Halichondria panicea]|uniref:condensin-2 complex subunit D3-L-like isoform X2 n=1 Tax=Halichondria panicea TaxID=6063 RepID=UPI00312B5FB3